MTTPTQTIGTGRLTQALYQRFGGPQTNREKLRAVPRQKLWDIVLNRRAKEIRRGENPVITKTIAELRRSGLEDPFEKIPEAAAHVRRLLRMYPRVSSPPDKALILFGSVVPPNQQFSYGQRIFKGMSAHEGGLEIFYNESDNAPARKQLGGFLPRDILRMPLGARTAICLELSFILIVILREAGIEAFIKVDPDNKHAFVVVLLGKDKIKLDPAITAFEKYSGDYDSDSMGAASHYSNKGQLYCDLKKLDAADECYDRALEINSSSVAAWQGKGEVFCLRGRTIEALQCLERALEILPNYRAAWYNKGTLLAQTGRTSEALICFDHLLELDPRHFNAWYNKGLALEFQRRYSEAIACFDKATEIDPNCADAWQEKGEIFKRQMKLGEAVQCFAKASALRKRE